MKKTELKRKTPLRSYKPINRISKKQQRREADLARKKKILMQSFKGFCPRCGKTGMAWEQDHKIPRSLGGSDDLDNLEIVCILCNRSKRIKKGDIKPSNQAR